MAKLVEDDYNGWTARRLSIAFSGQNVPAASVIASSTLGSGGYGDSLDDSLKLRWPTADGPFEVVAGRTCSLVPNMDRRACGCARGR
jgi:hypothetical protein